MPGISYSTSPRSAWRRQRCWSRHCPFGSGDQLRDLRRKHGTSHVFKRSGKSILCVPTKSGATHVGSAATPVAFHDNLGLCAALVRNALLDHLAGLRREIVDVQPISPWSKSLFLEPALGWRY